MDTIQMNFSKSDLPKTYEELKKKVLIRLKEENMSKIIIYYENNIKIPIIDSTSFDKFLQSCRNDSNIQLFIEEKKEMDDGEFFKNDPHDQIDIIITSLINNVKAYLGSSKQLIQKRNDKLIEDLNRVSLNKEAFDNQIEKYCFNVSKDLVLNTLPAEKNENIPPELRCKYCSNELDVAFELKNSTVKDYYLCQFCNLLLSSYFTDPFAIKRHFTEQPVLQIAIDHGFQAKRINDSPLIYSFKKMSQESLTIKVEMLNNGQHDIAGNKIEYRLLFDNSYNSISLKKVIPKNEQWVQEIPITNLNTKTEGKYEYKLQLYHIFLKKYFGEETQILIEIN